MTSPLPAHRPTAAAYEPGRRRSRVPLVLGVVAGAVVALCLSMVGLAKWSAGSDLDEARAVADYFLQRVEAGDDAAAYGALCASSQEKVSRQDFTTAVERPARAASHEVVRSGFLDEEGHSAVVNVRLTDRAGGAREVSVYLDEFGGRWLVCGDPFVGGR